jgi:hypothetical protein
MIKGSKHTKESIRKNSEAHKNEKHPFYGKKHSLETKKKISETHKREKNPNWKNGIRTDEFNYTHFKTPEGCKFSCMKEKSGYIKISRLIMAEYLQRPLDDKEVIHHKNKNNDNRIENLELFENHSEHLKLHHKLNKGKVEKCL